MLAETAYRVFGGLPMRTIRPIDAAAGAGKTPLLYVQSNRDRWGSLDDVADMVAATPKASPRSTSTPVIVSPVINTSQQPHVCIDFFQRAIRRLRSRDMQANNIIVARALPVGNGVRTGCRQAWYA